jgi:hypothetical protein
MQGRYLLGAITLFMVVLMAIYKVNQRRTSNLSFSGLVQKVKYDDNKSTPTVTVNGDEYYLSTNLNFDRMIEKGDSISKKKGEIKFRLVKKGTDKILVFED